MSYLPGWTDVTLRGESIGFVHRKANGLWVAVLEKDGETGKEVGTAGDKQAAIDIVKAAYLRT